MDLLGKRVTPVYRVLMVVTEPQDHRGQSEVLGIWA
jgi:hypothetical protein